MTRVDGTRVHMSIPISPGVGATARLGIQVETESAGVAPHRVRARLVRHRTAVINQRAGGTGLISGRKAFQKPMADGVTLLHAIQDVYLCDEVTIA